MVWGQTAVRSREGFIRNTLVARVYNHAFPGTPAPFPEYRTFAQWKECWREQVEILQQLLLDEEQGSAQLAGDTNCEDIFGRSLGGQRPNGHFWSWWTWVTYRAYGRYLKRSRCSLMQKEVIDEDYRKGVLTWYKRYVRSLSSRWPTTLFRTEDSDVPECRRKQRFLLQPANVMRTRREN